MAMKKMYVHQKDLCDKYGFCPTKLGLIYSMRAEGFLDSNVNPMYLYNKYTFKDLDEIMEAKQLKIQDFCESKQY